VAFALAHAHITPGGLLMYYWRWTADECALSYRCSGTLNVQRALQERMEGTASARRGRSIEENLAAWREMQAGSEEGLRHCLRLKMDPTAPNKALRDPAAFRCNLTPHHRTGTRFKARPLFICAFTCIPSLPCHMPHRAVLSFLHATSIGSAQNQHICTVVLQNCFICASHTNRATCGTWHTAARSQMRTCRSSQQQQQPQPHCAAELLQLLRGPRERS